MKFGFMSTSWELLYDMQLQAEAWCAAATRWWLSDSVSLVLCKHVSTVPLRLRWSGYASPSETNGHIMTQVRWLMTVPASSLALLLYHMSLIVYPISAFPPHPFNSQTFYWHEIHFLLWILHIAREMKSRSPSLSIIHHPATTQGRIALLIIRNIYYNWVPHFLLFHAMCSDYKEFSSDAWLIPLLLLYPNFCQAFTSVLQFNPTTAWFILISTPVKVWHFCICTHEFEVRHPSKSVGEGPSQVPVELQDAAWQTGDDEPAAHWCWRRLWWQMWSSSPISTLVRRNWTTVVLWLKEHLRLWAPSWRSVSSRCQEHLRAMSRRVLLEEQLRQCAGPSGFQASGRGPQLEGGAG